MSAMEMLKSVQFVVGQDGCPSGVQMDIKAWEAMLDWMEDVEDRAVVKEKIFALRSGPWKAGALRWEDGRADWERIT